MKRKSGIKFGFPCSILELLRTWKYELLIIVIVVKVIIQRPWASWPSPVPAAQLPLPIFVTPETSTQPAPAVSRQQGSHGDRAFWISRPAGSDPAVGQGNYGLFSWRWWLACLSVWLAVSQGSPCARGLLWKKTCARNVPGPPSIMSTCLKRLLAFPPPHFRLSLSLCVCLSPSPTQSHDREIILLWNRKQARDVTAAFMLGLDIIESTVAWNSRT